MMIYSNEPTYSLDRPPILLMDRRESFTCEECGRPGFGPKGMRVHPGRCREARDKKIAVRSARRTKARRQRVAQQAPVAIAC